MEQKTSLRFSHYEDEELAALGQQTLREMEHKAKAVAAALSAFSGALKKADAGKSKEHKRGELESRLESILDH